MDHISEKTVTTFYRYIVEHLEFLDAEGLTERFYEWQHDQQCALSESQTQHDRYYEEDTQTFPAEEVRRLTQK